MSQKCRVCGLYSPESAVRCDCGYDFASGTMKPSYLQAHVEQKHGGRANFLRATGRDNVRQGQIVAVLLLLLSAGMMFATGRVALFLPIVLAFAVLRVLRGMRQRREADSPRVDR